MNPDAGQPTRFRSIYGSNPPSGGYRGNMLRTVPLIIAALLFSETRVSHAENCNGAPTDSRRCCKWASGATIPFKLNATSFTSDSILQAHYERQ